MCLLPTVFAADTTPPTVTSSNPSGLIISNTLNLSVTTSENAICKYDTLNLIFVDMANTFSGSGTSHIQSLTLANNDYVYYVRCKDLSDNIMTSPKVISFTVDTTNGGDTAPPSIIDHAPHGTTSGYEHSLRVITNEEATCRFSETDVPFTSMTNTFSGTIDHTYTLGLSDGSYHYFVLCRDGANNTMSTPYEIEFSVDNDPPVILEYTPDASQTHSFEMEVTTNKPSTCKYSKTAGLSYANMESIFATTGYTIHRSPLTFDDDGFKTLYVKCKDGAGNIQDDDFLITIDVDVPPTAQITMSEESPIKPGTIYITLIASEALIMAPQLTYTLYDKTGSSTTFTVPLQGTGQVWNGYMIVSESENKKIGSFSFQGIDFGGNTGTSITSGNTFIVDSSIPEQIDTLEAVPQSDGSIKLVWEFENDDDIEKYYIYRSLSSNVDPLDYYDEVSAKRFIDEETKNNTQYFYKIAAVDSAGNRGFLSKEVDATSNWNYGSDGSSSTSSSSSTTSSSKTLKSNLIPLVDQAIDDAQPINTMILNSATYYLSKQDDEIITNIKLHDDVKEAKKKFDSYITQLESLKKTDYSKDTLETEIKKIELRIESLKKEFSVRVDVVKTIDISTTATLADISNGIGYLMNLLRIIDLKDEYRESLQTESAKIAEKYDITGTATILKVQYPDGSSKDYLYIDKKIKPKTDSVPDETGIIVIEDIPNDVAGDVKELHYVTSGSTILKSDTVVKWDLEKLNGEIAYYTIGNYEDLDSISIPSIILDNYEHHFDLDGSEPTKESGNFLTGNVIANSINALKENKERFGIAIGILVVVALGVYYFTMDNEPPKNEGAQKNKNGGNGGISQNIQRAWNSLFSKRGEQTQQAHAAVHHHSEKQVPSAAQMHDMPTNIAAPPVYNHGNVMQHDNHTRQMSNLKNIYLAPLEKHGGIEKELRRAHELIDNMSFHEANMLYFSILNSQELDTPDEAKKQQIYQELHVLHKKLSLYMKIYEANINQTKTDRASVTNDLNDISYFYNIIAKEHEYDSKLMQYARENHERLRSFVLTE